jgi:hypothetical protein
MSAGIRLLWAVVCLVWLSMPLPVLAKDVNSSLGYQLKVPAGWIVMSREEVRDNPNLIDIDKASNDLPGPLMEQVRPMIREGKVDIFFHPDGSTFFVDNINILKQMGQSLPPVAENGALCAALGQELTQAFGRPIAVYACERRKMAGRDSLYLDFDGVVPGTRSLQYQVQRSDNVALIITATAKNETLAVIRSEFEAIMATLRLP